MPSWLDRPGSLNWANKKKLSAGINEFETTLSAVKNQLLQLLKLVAYWENHCKNLSELSQRQLLTAKHILDLNPALTRSKHVHEILNVLSHQYGQIPEHEDTPSLRML